MKRPEFNVFREMFLDCLCRGTELDPAAAAEKKWADMGEQADRRKILESVNKRLKKEYGVEFDINHRLLSVDGPVESAIIQTFHELSTINIMERINAKIKARMN
ncbi:hypothetical protein [Pelotomaculum propionicicum]|uniref:Uncharacterized protein n=1 Tax=Pelotomaculum propionicicum TaxID=258475 RepID=A0A4Y7RTN0_9FIRM|nr:hypothetical protein [Pelotomaculum propionicicum]NLI11614.1 hypothetical protein [Peptococcaceae bacterium]TEB12335.1 hypothetical protein Pmgp_00952 [Pelotomaculum propionicicum]